MFLVRNFMGLYEGFQMFHFVLLSQQKNKIIVRNITGLRTSAGKDFWIHLASIHDFSVLLMIICQIFH